MKRARGEDLEHVLAKKIKDNYFEHLSNDLSAVKRFLDELEADDNNELLQSYLNSGKDGTEIVSYMSSDSPRSSVELITVVNLLSVLILRTSKLPSHQSVAVKMCDELIDKAKLATLYHCMAQAHSRLSIQVLLLLSTMAAMNESIAKSLSLQFCFDNGNFLRCAKSRRVGSKLDARSCFLQFILALCLHSKHIWKDALSNKDLLAALTSDLYLDTYSNLMLVMDLLINKLLAANLGKSIRMRIFGGSTLSNILSAYGWKGGASSKKEAANLILDDVDEAELDAVHQRLSQFLSVLGTGAHGIVFSPKRILQLDSGPPPNNLWLFVLKSPHLDYQKLSATQQQFFYQSLFRCWDLIDLYMEHVSPAMLPRKSANWFSAMKFVTGFYEFVNVRAVELMLSLAPDALTSCSGVGKVLLSICTPSGPEMRKHLVSGMTHEEPEVVEACMRLLKVMRATLALLLTWIDVARNNGELPVNQRPACEIRAIPLEQLRMRLKVDSPQRLPENIKWRVKIAKLFHRQFLDPAVLSDQIVSEAGKATADEAPDQSNKQTVDIQSPSAFSLEDQLALIPDDYGGLVRKLARLHEKQALTEKKQRKLLASLIPVLVELLDLPPVPVIWRGLADLLRLLPPESVSWKKGVLAPDLNTEKFPCLPVFRWLTVERGNRSLDILLERCPPDTSHVTELKEALTHLLAVFVHQKARKCASSLSYPVILASYRGSLSFTDQLLFSMLVEYDKQGLSVDYFKNGCMTWGPRMRECFQFPTSVPSLNIEPMEWARPGKHDCITLLLDEAALLRSITSFPVKLFPTTFPREDKCDAGPLGADLVNPVFFLSVFNGYLQAPDPDLRLFHERHCLSLCVSALSSYSSHVRSIARANIARFHSCLPVSLAHEAPSAASAAPASTVEEKLRQVRFVLELVRNSLAKGGVDKLDGAWRSAALMGHPSDTGLRLTRVHALFFARAVELLLKPAHRMFQVVWNFMMAKPAAKLNTVPDFLRMLYSTDLDFRLERQWLFSWLADAMVDRADYLLLERAHVIKHALVCYNMENVESSTQTQILRLLVNISRLRKSAHALIRFHLILFWIARHCLLVKHQEQISLFHQLIQNILAAMRPADCVEIPSEKHEQIALAFGSTLTLLREFETQFDVKCALSSVETVEDLKHVETWETHIVYSFCK